MTHAASQKRPPVKALISQRVGGGTGISAAATMGRLLPPIQPKAPGPKTRPSSLQRSNFLSVVSSSNAPAVGKSAYHTEGNEAN